MNRIAINGFGRIGRLTFRELLTYSDIEVVAINDLTDAKTLGHLLKYDTNQGRFDGEVVVKNDTLIVNGKEIKLFAQRDPALLPWKDLGIDVVVESTGVFRDKAGASKHLEAGAKRVVISSPASGDVKTVVIGVNDQTISDADTIISNASCTTNCLAPVAMVLDEEFGIEKGYINTVHAYTADQNLQDAPHKDLRRARAASRSIIPTSTGAAKAVGLVLPQLNERLDGNATRVPVSAGSMTDFVVLLKKEATVDAINQAMKKAAEGKLKGILEYMEDPIVSSDIIGSRFSSIFDAGLTHSNGNFVKVISWYDNEFGYASRTAELVAKLLNFRKVHEPLKMG